MKENPKDTQLRKDMVEGRLVKDGFLGEDDRSLLDIVAADLAVLEARGVTQQQLGQAMRALMEKGLTGMGMEVDAGKWLVKTEEYMGRMGCPFKDGHRAAKRNTTLTDKASGQTITFSDLNIHLIEKHGFFQGEGSPYRLEPEVLAELVVKTEG